MSRIQDKVALVTGSNRGIGKALVDELLARGVAKVYAAARNTDAVGEVFSDERVVPVQLEVTDGDRIAALGRELSDVSLLINNAGIAGFQGVIGAETIETARDEMEVNYFGPLMLTRAFAPVLKANGGGAVVTVASIASLVCFPVLGSYNASKAAAHLLTLGARAELAGQGTFVAGVYPGPIDTDMTAGFDAEKTAPEAVARTVLDGLEAGKEDIFPDPASAEMYAGYRADPQAIQHQMAEG